MLVRVKEGENEVRHDMKIQSDYEYKAFLCFVTTADMVFIGKREKNYAEKEE